MPVFFASCQESVIDVPIWCYKFHFFQKMIFKIKLLLSFLMTVFVFFKVSFLFVCLFSLLNIQYPRMWCDGSGLRLGWSWNCRPFTVCLFCSKVLQTSPLESRQGSQADAQGFWFTLWYPVEIYGKLAWWTEAHSPAGSLTWETPHSFLRLWKINFYGWTSPCESHYDYKIPLAIPMRKHWKRQRLLLTRSGN